MFLPSYTIDSKPAEVPAIVRTLTRSDVQWNRRLFRPPPLVVRPQAVDFSGLSVAAKVDPKRS